MAEQRDRGRSLLSQDIAGDWIICFRHDTLVAPENLTSWADEMHNRAVALVRESATSSPSKTT